VFDNDSDVKQFGESYYLLQNEADGLYVRKAIALTITPPSTYYYHPSVAAALLADNTAYLLDAPNEVVVLAVGKTINNDMGKDVSNLTVNPTTAEYAVQYANGSYTATNTSTTYYWAGTTDSAWATLGNWKVGASDGPVATRTFESTDSVVFNNGATVTLGASVIVAGVTVNGAVSISGTAKELKTTGNITGTGTLTLSDVCLSGDGANITVAPNIHFTNDSEFAGDNVMTINGNVEISGSFKIWGVNHIIAGTAQINGGADFGWGNAWLMINGAATVKGAFTTGGTKLKFSNSLTIEAGGVTVDGSSVNLDSDTATVVLAGAGATLTDSRGAPIADNKVSTSVADSYVKKTGSTFAVAAKPVVTISVGANVSLTIDGNAVADGDTFKFFPGDTFTYVATPAANYTATVTVTGGTDSDGTVTVGETAITVAATATLNTYTITIPVVANTTVSVSYTSGGEELVATAAGDITVDAGTDVTANWTAASGYRITSGASQTLNAVTSAQTLTPPTVAANSVEFSNFAVEYLADFSKAATITATVTGDGAEDATYTITAGGEPITGTYSNGTVTFNDVDCPSIGGTLSYTISASGTTSGTSTPQTSTVGNVTSGWVQENSTHYEATGSWATDFTYTDGKATLTDNTYTANTAGDGIVTLTTVVKFGGDADSEVQVGDDAQAAVRIQNSKFEVWGKTTFEGTAAWQTTEVAAVAATTYTVSLTINYTTGKFTVSVGEDSLGEYFLATNATKISSVAYKGTGEFTSLNGSFVSGDIPVDVVSEDDVAVSSAFISEYLTGKTVAEAALALAPDATPESNPAAFAAGGNGINYFKCYALGLDPTKEEDKPIVDVTTDANGNYVFTVKHPVYNEQGAIAGYEEIDAADNVTTTVTLKYGTDADTQSWTSAVGTSFAPNALPFGENNNVLYYKAEVTISAK